MPIVAENTTEDNQFPFDASTDRMAQTFTPTHTSVLWRVTLSLIRVGSPTGDFTIWVESTDGTHPDGTQLTDIVTVEATTLSTSQTENTFTFTNRPVINSGTLYAVVFDCTGVSGVNHVDAYYDQHPGNPYANGRGWQSTDNGASWASIAGTGDDFWFRVEALGGGRMVRLVGS